MTQIHTSDTVRIHIHHINTSIQKDKRYIKKNKNLTSVAITHFISHTLVQFSSVQFSSVQFSSVQLMSSVGSVSVSVSISVSLTVSVKVRSGQVRSGQFSLPDFDFVVLRPSSLTLALQLVEYSTVPMRLHLLLASHFDNQILL